MIENISYYIWERKKTNGKVLTDDDLRRIYGVLCGAYGIIVNLVLFVFKFAVSFICDSKAVLADGVHSLADSIASVAVLLSFTAAKAKYAETAASLAVCFILIYGGIKNASVALMNIVNPQTVEFSVVGVVLLTVSLFAKIYMSVFNKKASKKINSKALGASFADSFCDTVSTLSSLFSVVAAAFTTANFDAYCTLSVAVIMIFAGFFVVISNFKG